MKNIEDRLKDLILSRYDSIREFTKVIDIPYSTFDSIMRRGIRKATVDNVLKICTELNISADALGNGEIVFNKDVESTPIKKERSNDITDILALAREQLLTSSGLMFNGKPADEESIQSILSAMEVGLEIAKRKHKK